MFTDIYKISNHGELSFYATYSLHPEEALRCAALQQAKRFDTWNYQRIYIPITEKDGKFYFFFGDNQVLFTSNFR